MGEVEEQLATAILGKGLSLLLLKPPEPTSDAMFLYVKFAKTGSLKPLK
jgi:hypothetical protein